MVFGENTENLERLVQTQVIWFTQGVDFPILKITHIVL